MLEMQKMGTKERVTMPQNFITFRNGYLFVYSLMMGECVLFSHSFPGEKQSQKRKPPSHM